MPALDRRRFLELSGAAAAAGLLGGLTSTASVAAASLAQAQTDVAPVGNRTLIVVEMEGGNDALNTLVPQSGTYHDLRPTIGLSDDELVGFAGLDYGANPALAPLRERWEAGHMAAIYGVGLREQSRSHFVAQDAWRSARPGEPATSGWLGRWLEATEPADEVPLRAISLGRSTLAAEGETGRPVAIQSVDGYRLNPPRGNAAVIDAMLTMATPMRAGVFGEAQNALPETIESVDLLQGIIARAASTAADLGPDPTTALFAAAQAIIQADVGTEVLYLTVPGFDTHASQRALQDALLGTVAGSLSSLFDSLDASGHGDRVVAVTVSEFGRRAGENASAGTDHGAGGLTFVVGPAVGDRTIVGEAGIENLTDGDLPIVVDTRSVYQDALGWLGADSSVVADVLGGEWDNLALLRPQ